MDFVVIGRLKKTCSTWPIAASMIFNFNYFPLFLSLINESTVLKRHSRVCNRSRLAHVSWHCLSPFRIKDKGSSDSFYFPAFFLFFSLKYKTWYKNTAQIDALYSFITITNFGFLNET